MWPEPPTLVPTCRGSLMYVQAVGWQLARKDKIDLDSATLHQKQGLCVSTAQCLVRLEASGMTVCTAWLRMTGMSAHVHSHGQPANIANPCLILTLLLAAGTRARRRSRRRSPSTAACISTRNPST